MQKIINFFRYYQLPILSGILIGTSFIPFPPWAALFCLTPLWLFWVKETSIKKILVGGWITQFILTLIGFNWVAYTIHHFGHFPWPLAFVGLMLFCAIANFYFVVTGALFWLFSHKYKVLNSVTQKAIFLTCCFWLLETYFPVIFKWNLGYTWIWINAPIYQLAEYIGFSGLSLIVVIINGFIFKAWHQKTLPLKAKKMALPINTFLILNVAGFAVQMVLPTPEKTARVLLVQANIGNLMKQLAEHGYGFRNHIINEYLSLAKEAVSKNKEIDFMVWPETAFPDQMFHNGGNNSNTHRVLRFLKTNQLAGAIGAYSFDNKQKLVSNSFFTLNKDAEFTDSPYSKTHLLAYGEYIPGAKILPQLKNWIPASEFARGPGPVVKSLPPFKLGPQICYESLFPYFTKQLADQKAQMIVNLTNDSWYGTWQEPYQHLYMTLARAIEFRRPVIRSTNTGISTVMLANGEVLEISPLHEKWWHLYEVKYNENPKETFYQKTFWLTTFFAFFVLILSLLWRARATTTIKIH